jgi:hypothetical protein
MPHDAYCTTQVAMYSMSVYIIAMYNMWCNCDILSMKQVTPSHISVLDCCYIASEYHTSYRKLLVASIAIGLLCRHHAVSISSSHQSHTNHTLSCSEVHLLLQTHA